MTQQLARAGVPEGDLRLIGRLLKINLAGSQGLAIGTESQPSSPPSRFPLQAEALRAGVRVENNYSLLVTRADRQTLRVGRNTYVVPPSRDLQLDGFVQAAAG